MFGLFCIPSCEFTSSTAAVRLFSASESFPPPAFRVAVASQLCWTKSQMCLWGGR